MKCLYYVVIFFILHAAAFAEVQFVDATATAGITFRHIDGRTGEKYLIETLGSGALFFDYDADGALDLYIVNATHIPPSVAEDTSQAHLPRNTLYRNNGNGTFTDITQKAGVGDIGYGVGCASADIDNDGYPDIYITNYGQNRLYYNNGDGTFTDITQKAGVGDERWGTSCAFLDYDVDGDIDLYVVNYMKFSVEENRWWETRGIRTYCSPTDQIAGSHFVSEPDILYRNNGDGTFTDVTETAGSHIARSVSLLRLETTIMMGIQTFILPTIWRQIFFTVTTAMAPLLRLPTLPAQATMATAFPEAAWAARSAITITTVTLISLLVMPLHCQWSFIKMRALSFLPMSLLLQGLAQ